MDRFHPYKDAGTTDLRAEIAAAAARLVADEGLDYAEAKQRGVREIVGNGPVPRNCLPKNEELEAALLEHLELFDPQHRQRLNRMRTVAIDWMQRLERFVPLATGAVWKGIATEFAIIHLQLFFDNGKELQYFLLDQHIEFESISVSHFKGGGEVEAYQFDWQDQSIVLSVYDHDDIKGALKVPSSSHAEIRRAERGTLVSLMALTQPGTPNGNTSGTQAP